MKMTCGNRYFRSRGDVISLPRVPRYFIMVDTGIIVVAEIIGKERSN